MHATFCFENLTLVILFVLVELDLDYVPARVGNFATELSAQLNFCMLLWLGNPFVNRRIHTLHNFGER